MNGWVMVLIAIVAAMAIIGNFSTVKRNAKTPLRKKGLNDLKETLPRSNKTKYEFNSQDKKNAD